MITNTIVAPATPYGIGGIAVVRLSGPQSRLIVYKLLYNNGLNVDLQPRYATLLNIYSDNGVAIDEPVITFFKAPHSYTGEDMVEISCHGSTVVVDKIVSTCCHFGATIAEPGEFTKRAFINGKMDLVQAEAVASLINSQSEESSRLNLRLLRGELSGRLNILRKKLIDVLSMVEFELDISEDELQPNLKSNVSISVENIFEEVTEFLNSYKQARLLNRGAMVVIAGPPNVGKSTLLNILSETNRAITSNFAGTTRDAIDIQMIFEGVPIKLVDTAGIRETKEEIEKQGVSRTLDYLDRADLILSVVDINTVDVSQDAFSEKIPLIKILNKVDLLSKTKLEVLQSNHLQSLLISSKTGHNIKLLKQRIKTALGINSSVSDTLSITTNRQQQALKQCSEKLHSTSLLLRHDKIAYELISIELRETLNSLDVILGKSTPDDILNNIFNQFCVGK